MANMYRVIVLLILTLTGSLSYGYDQRPKITTPDKDEIVIDANKDFVLTCESNSPMNWTVPTLDISQGDDITLNITSSTRVHSTFRYVSHLQLIKPQHYNTGYYKCFEVENESSSDDVYIYVKDKEYPFVQKEETLIYLPVVQYKSAVFDCRPNSPDIEVKLETSTDVECKLGENPDDGTVLEYNSKIGFTMHHVNNKQGGLYNCVSGETTLMILLQIMPHTDSMAKPMISSLPHVVVEDDVTLTCTVTVDFGVTFSMDWDTPNNKALKEGRIKVGVSASISDDKLGRSVRTGIRNLTIYNISKEDQGYYICRVEDHAGNKNNNSKRIIVHDKNVSYINFLLDGDMSINETVGTEAKWVVNLEAYPKPTLTWYKPDRTPIKGQDKYAVQTYEAGTQTKLVIHDIKFRDRGVYKLEAINENVIEVANFTLIVRGRPIVELHLNESYALGVDYNIICEVEGYPIPNITWYFKPCKLMRDCSSEGGFIALPKSYYRTEEIDDANVKSTLSIKTTTSGFLMCSAINTEQGTNETSGLLVSDIKHGEIFSAWGPNIIVTGDDVTLACGVTRENYTSDLHWYIKSPSGDTKINVSGKVYPVTTSMTPFSYQTKLSIPNIQKSDSAIFVCSVMHRDDGKDRKEIEVHVQSLKKPFLKNTTMNTSEISLKTTDVLNLSCSFEGLPKPTITWYKDGTVLQPQKNIEISENNESIYFPFIRSVDEGVYKCEATNRAGTMARQITVKLIDKPGPSVPMITAIVIVALILVVLIAVLVVKIRKERKLRHELAVAGLKNFEEGAMESLNPELPVDDQAELLPYDKKWEFPRCKLKLGKQLGAGAFGVVMKADAYGIVEGEAVSTVAVKMVKRNADFTYIKALASELKIMVHLGKHLNVVNLLGACTNNIVKRELLVIVEYCRFGNLHNYLLRHRENFIDQVDLKTGAIDPQIGLEILNRAESFNSKTSGDNAHNAPDDIAVDYRVGAMGSQSTDSSNMEGSISMAPAGEDSYLMSNNSVQPEWRSNYRGDYKGTVRPICTRDLVCWAFQVARGMEYLAGRKVLHGDLAARNILLADDNIVKICDFGLAKSMYKSDNYKKKGDGPLPVKWMAIESIRDRVFSTQSDVWSFGIVLWEFFSLARTPYPGMEADEKLYNKLVDGYRMEKPLHATYDIYHTMQECWQAHPDRRPTFSDLSVQLGAFLEESVRRHYIELNDPYIDMNEQWLQGIGSDYLSMMNAPTYGNLVSPSVDECDNGYINSPVPSGASAMEIGEGSGYLCMKSPSTANSPDIFSPRVATVGDTVFDFSTPQQKRLRFSREGRSGKGHELHPILKTQHGGSESDTEQISDLNKGLSVEEKGRNDMTSNNSPDKTNPSFSNPSYHSMPPINPSPDNYINMPQHKTASKDQKCSDLNDMSNEKVPSGFSNPSYITMGLTNDNKNPNNGNLQNPFSNQHYPISSGGNDSYVNLPR